MPRTSAHRMPIAGAGVSAGGDLNDGGSQRPGEIPGRLAPNLEAYALGLAVDTTQPDLIAKLERVQEAKQRLQSLQNPLGLGVRDQGRPSATSPSPTPEREFKSGHGLADVVLREASGRYVTTRRERSPIEVHAKSFTEEELFYAAMFLRDAEMAEKRPVTAAYDGMPRQVSGPRPGGVPDKFRMAHNRVCYIEQRLEEEFKDVADWLLKEVRREATGTTASLGDIGHEKTAIRDKATARGVGLGLLKGTIWRIMGLYQAMRRIDDDMNQVAHQGPYLVPPKK